MKKKLITKLYKSNSDKKLAGLCGGIGESLGIDSTILRLIWALSIIFMGFGLWAYIICAIVIPNEPENRSGNMTAPKEDNKDIE